MGMEYSEQRRVAKGKRNAKAKRAVPVASEVRVTRADGNLEVQAAQPGGDAPRTKAHMKPPKNYHAFP
jgi:hypothetical protein